MKKTRKSGRGRNVFGDKCREKILKLNKETAIDQYIEMMKDLLVNGKNSSIEYTIDSSCFTREEEEAFFQSVEGINSLFARMMNRNYTEYTCKY